MGVLAFRHQPRVKNIFLGNTYIGGCTRPREPKQPKQPKPTPIPSAACKIWIALISAKFISRRVSPTLRTRPADQGPDFFGLFEVLDGGIDVAAFSD